MTSNSSKAFDPEIRRIEQEITGFFAEKTPEYTGRHPIVSAVMAYFYIRRSLTQQDLRKLTGFSAGAISKAVRQLVDMNVITREMIPGTHMHIYKMETLPFRSPSYFLQTEKTLEKLHKELKEMKDTMDAHGDKMRKSEDYQRVYAFVTQLLELISSVPRFMALIEEELEKFVEKGKR
ncbi:MarR family transcriptional regulator [Candidatus Bathyarchaeota archaeon]|nr:MarR family transcriptional regulator [Candidatus Bathyarchaeota archaeon]